MIHTLIFGTPARSDRKDYGTLKRIIINAGIANQITVDPGVFGIERIIPISAVHSATAELIDLPITDDEWQAFAAYHMESIFSTSTDDDPSLGVMHEASAVGANMESVAGSQENLSPLDETSVVLSPNTVLHYGDQRAILDGLIAETGRPTRLLLDGGRTIAYDAVETIDDGVITLRADAVPQEPES